MPGTVSALVVTPADVRWALGLVPDRKARLDKLVKSGEVVIVDEVDGCKTA